MCENMCTDLLSGQNYQLSVSHFKFNKHHAEFVLF